MADRPASALRPASAVRPATVADVGRLARTTVRAFAADPLMRWFFPDDADYEACAPEVYASMFRRTIALGHCLTTDDGVAVAGWIPPDPPLLTSGSSDAAAAGDASPDPGPHGAPAAEPGASEAPASEVSHPAWRMERFAATAAMLRAEEPAEPHWYLSLLATHPDWQRQGIGAQLVSARTETAAADGIACYLETQTAENVAWYLRQGFRVRSEWDLPLDGPHMWGMIRDAN